MTEVIKALVHFDGCIKSFDSEDEHGSFGNFEGYASTYGNIDRTGDIIVPGAFDSAIKSGKKIKMLWQHGFTNVIGSFTEILEDAKGLFVKGRINLGTQKGREAYSLLKAGDIDSMSIGFRVMKDGFEIDRGTGLRILKALSLMEISLVTEPANELAQVTNVKSVVPFQDLELADREIPWDGEAAINRVKEYTDSIDSPSADYKNAFLWFDDEASSLFGSYKLPIADVVDGELKAIPRALFAARAAIGGARGGVDIPESDKVRISRNIDRYLEDMDEKSFDLAEMASLSDVEKSLKNRGFSSTEAKTIISKVKEFTVKRDANDELTLKQREVATKDLSDVKAQIDQMLKQIKGL